MTSANIKAVMTQKAQQLIESLEASNVEELNECISEINAKLMELSAVEQDIDIGTIDESIQEKIKECFADDNLRRIAEREVRDIKERLEYIKDESYKASSQTIDIVDKLTQLLKDAAEQRKSLMAEKASLQIDWQAVDPAVVAFLGKLEAYIMRSEDNAKFIKSEFSNIILAQAFQDLTGQMVNGLLDTFGKAEGSLIKLIQIARLVNGEDPEEDAVHNPSGPQLNPDVSQDDIDDLFD